MIRTFFSNWRAYGRAVAWWNLRFNVGYAILPGPRKHARCFSGGAGIRSKSTTGAK